MSATVDGKRVQIGETVSFKSDVEQYGTLIEIEKRGAYTALHLKSPHVEGFEGEYIGGQDSTWVAASSCWLD